MLNLSYRYDQNSSSLKIDGIPDVSIGDSTDTIGILSLWTLQIIGFPVLEGKKEHLKKLMQAVLQYSRYYISGIRKTIISNDNIVQITPLNNKHKLLLTSTKTNTKPLEITLDDSELADLTRCFDLLRFDSRVRIDWQIENDYPLKRREIYNSSVKSTFYNYLPSLYGLLIFLLTSSALVLIPTTTNLENIQEQPKINSPKNNK